jgi:hypothetical protein
VRRTNIKLSEEGVTLASVVIENFVELKVVFDILALCRVKSLGFRG